MLQVTDKTQFAVFKRCDSQTRREIYKWCNLLMKDPLYEKHLKIEEIRDILKDSCMRSWEINVKLYKISRYIGVFLEKLIPEGTYKRRQVIAVLVELIIPNVTITETPEFFDPKLLQLKDEEWTNYPFDCIESMNQHRRQPSKVLSKTALPS